MQLLAQIVFLRELTETNILVPVSLILYKEKWRSYKSLKIFAKIWILSLDYDLDNENFGKNYT